MKKLTYLSFIISFFIYGEEIDQNKVHLFRKDSSAEKGTIILICGLTSCGKSSSSKALQKKLAEQNKPFILLGMDSILETLPTEWINLDASDGPTTVREEGLSFKQVKKTKKEKNEEKNN